MDDVLFSDLVSSLKEAKAIQSGKAKPSRAFHIDALNVKAIRGKTGMTQEAFASAIRVSFRTLQNWEQSRRHPNGPAAALLIVLASAPDVALNALRA